jgi:hypothetical protein
MRTTLTVHDASDTVVTSMRKDEHCNTFLSRKMVQQIIQDALEAGNIVRLSMSNSEAVSDI